MHKTILDIGDLVVLKDKKYRKKTIRDKLFKSEFMQDIGIGIITEKLEELFVFPDITLEEFIALQELTEEITIYDLTNKQTPKKVPIQTSIVRVLWIKIDKNRWEYEEDLEIYKAPKGEEI